MKQLDIVIQQEQLSKVNCILIKIIKSVILYSMMLREEAEQKLVIIISLGIEYYRKAFYNSNYQSYSVFY
jgi:hypothetical protein